MFDKNLKLTLDATKRKLSDAEAENAALRQENGKLKEALKVAPSFEVSVNRRVNSVLASVGVTQFAAETVVPQDAAPGDAQDLSLAAQFDAMEPGGARTQFYDKHKEAIQRGLNKRK